MSELMIPSLTGSLTGTKLESLYGDVGQDGLFIFSYTLLHGMSELMIPSLTGTKLVMRAYSLMTELMSPRLTGTKTGTKTCYLFPIIRRSRPYILCIN